MVSYRPTAFNMKQSVAKKDHLTAPAHLAGAILGSSFSLHRRRITEAHEPQTYVHLQLDLTVAGAWPY